MHSDVAIVGAGPAGLQAALTLGRMRRDVVVFDHAAYRNDAEFHLHNFLGQDGVPPREFREAARRDLAEYDTVRIVEDEVTRISGEFGAFTVEAANGAATVRAVILATGLRDVLPDIPGLEPLYGTVVVHCPYCHGFEKSGKSIGVLAADEHAVMVVALLARIGSEFTVFAHGEEPDDGVRERLENQGVRIVDGVVTEARIVAGGVALEVDGTAHEVGALFVEPSWQQSAPFCAQLDLEMSDDGAILIDALGQTSREGVYGAGDLAHPRGLPTPTAAVLSAANAGLTAAATCDRALALADLQA